MGCPALRTRLSCDNPLSVSASISMQCQQPIRSPALGQATAHRTLRQLLSEPVLHAKPAFPSTKPSPHRQRFPFAFQPPAQLTQVPSVNPLCLLPHPSSFLPTHSAPPPSGRPSHKFGIQHSRRSTLAHASYHRDTVPSPQRGSLQRARSSPRTVSHGEPRRRQ
ncbi:hypothetical protein EJ04DRAFT_30308 [Polyplosphaeria fusca]|uniref:Uncharacterized protein n=1 Tax=Polyplosphaeria fusca TaxID=682080 RepID=A0A9P4UZ69_9PLEO|nr:hypothetical protein EJ04DRAFT_30308 [Polyplosphaeria fusca]